MFYRSMISALSLVLTALLFSCTHAPKNPFQGSQPVNRISLMSYNVENLFDTQKDEGKQDYTFLPLGYKKNHSEVLAYCERQSGGRRKECLNLDWNAKTLSSKIEALGGSILQVYERGPDILMLQEVENINVLKQLNDQALQAANYKTVVLIEGEDTRGIDVGLLSRLDLAGQPKLHSIQWKEALEYSPRATRGILQVPLKLPGGETLHVFVLHFPSQASPTIYRKDGVETIKTLVSKIPESDYWVVGGDWNITYSENEKSGLVSKDLASIGHVTHLVGCQKCKGTHNYRKDWSFLDMMVFSKNFKGTDKAQGYKLKPESITVPMWGPGQAKASGRPYRFDPEKHKGVADHFPIYAEIEWIEKTKE